MTTEIPSEAWRNELLSELPPFFSRPLDGKGRCTGIFIDISKMGGGAAFAEAVNHLFVSCAYFVGLDYHLFCALLYDFSPGCELEKRGRVRLADEIGIIPAARQALYRDPIVSAKQAEYLFEPVFLEHETELPLQLDDTGEGPPPPQKSLIAEPAQLDLDEFIALMWLKGVRFGLSLKAIAPHLRSTHIERATIATETPFQPGKDASVKEESRDIHRDNAPRILGNGRLDLNSYRNRFPQMAAGIRLLRKIPRQLGVAGRDIHGNVLEPPLPLDINLDMLAGPGTGIDRTAEAEYLLTSRAGFLSIDAESGQFSVSEKIVSREGISSRTTGDLFLDGEEFEEYGEIQERRLLDGKTITVHADVFGIVVSHGGKITLKHNLIGGKAENYNGDIVVEGLASAAQLFAWKGEVHLTRAEKCLIVAKRVVIKNATLCDILADEILIEVASGCTIEGRQVRIETATASRQSETTVALLVPSLAEFEKAEIDIRNALAKTEAAMNAKSAEIETLKKNPELRSYLLIAGKLQKKEMSLSPEQKTNFLKLGQRIGPELRAFAALNERMQVLTKDKISQETLLATLEEERRQAGANISCNIKATDQEMRVFTRPIGRNPPALTPIPIKDLELRLHARTPGSQLLFGGESGSFEWQYDDRETKENDSAEG